MTQGQANRTGDASEVLSQGFNAGPDNPARKAARTERILLIATCVLMAWFYLWTARSNGAEWRWGEEQDDYFNLLIDGWLDGQLHLKVEVPEALLKLADPYDPKQRPPGLALHDASLYQGKYYVYFGVAPVVVLMLPWRVMTGADLPLFLAVPIFVYVGFLASLAIWLGIRRRYFPHAGTGVTVACAFVLGVSSLGPVLLRRPEMWELPIGGGYAFVMLALWAIFQSLHSPRRARWFGLAGLFLGLAIASRPPYLLASPFLLVPLLAWWREERRVPWRAAWSAFVPLAAVGGLMALHNYLRFDHPLQFGQAYQLSFDYESKMAHFRPSYVPFNGWRYFFSMPQWSWYYPFISPAVLPPKPVGFSGHDHVFGLVPNLPFVLLALAAPFAVWRRKDAKRSALAVWLMTAGVLVLIMASVLCSFFGSLARYMMDFTPTLMLLAGVGLLVVTEAAGAWSGWRRRALHATWTALLVYSVAFGALYSLQLDLLLYERNPALHYKLAAVFNRVAYAAERLTGGAYGPIELTIRLSPQPGGTRETLVALGHSPEDAYLFIQTTGDGRVQFGLEGTGGAPQLSWPIALDRKQPHRVTLSTGALYPPEKHPYFSAFTSDKRLARLRRLTLDVNGERVIDAFLRSPVLALGNVRVGKDAAGKAFRPFTGTLVSVARGETGSGRRSSAGAPTAFGRWWIDVPAANSRGRLPLLTAQTADPRGQTLFIEALGEGRAVVGLTAAHGELLSEPFPVAPGTVGEIEVRMDIGPSGGLRVWQDGILRWSPRVDWSLDRVSAPASPTSGTTSGPSILNAHFSREGTDPLLTLGGPLRLRVVFPTGRTGAREPLAVAGRRGEADFLSVEYQDSDYVRFAFDHWGLPQVFSEPVRLDYTQTHELEIDFGTSAAPAELPSEQIRREAVLTVRVNGAVVWRRPSHFFNTPPEELAIGRNAIGGTTCALTFTGKVLAAERLPQN